MRRHRLRAYQEVVRPDEVPDDQMLELVRALLDHLKLEIVREQTPDYTAFELHERHS